MTRWQRVLLVIGATALGLSGFLAPAQACTTFLLEDGAEVRVGKSYDWHTSEGIMLFNKRGVERHSLVMQPGATPLSWVSRYANLTFNQYGRGMPHGGMNTAGLIVEIMWLRATKTPPLDERPALNELQWIQYQLDNFTTVAEVSAHARGIRVAPVHGKVHYLVCDITAACAAFEYLDGELHISEGEALVTRVLTNSTYPQSAQYISSFEGFGGKRKVPSTSSSLDRFARAALLTETTPAEPLEDLDERTFSILDSVKQGDYTKWQIVYDPRRLRVAFRTEDSAAIKFITLPGLDPSCQTPVSVLDIDERQAGDVHDRLEEYRPSHNRELLTKTLAPLSDALPRYVRSVLTTYPASMRCVAP